MPQPGQIVPTEVPGKQVPQGFDSERSTEIMGEREERQRTFLNPDGTHTTRFYSEPVNYQNENGVWTAVDTTLTRKDASGTRTMGASDQRWETNSTEMVISFAGSADADVVLRMQLDDELSIAYGFDEASLSPGRTDGSKVTYQDVRPSSDVEFLVGSDSVKETLILKDEQAPTEWRFPLDLKGLTARLDGHGNLLFVDAEGTQRAWTPAGWMEDSAFAEDANEGVISSGVTYSLAEEAGRQVLVVKLDEEWLSDPDRVFPVRVDPSVKSIDATSGTYVEYPYNQNFASDTVLKIGTYDGGGHKAAGFLRFTGVESTLKNAWVLGADLALYNTWSQSCTARPVTVHPITSNWSESTTTKYPGPSTGSSLASKSFAHGWRPAGTTTWSCGPAWESIKLGSAGRKLVDDWTHGRKKNYGLAVKASTSDSKSWKQFGSDDYPGGKPSLDVTWTKYGATYKLGDFTAPVTATTEGVQKVTVTNQGQTTWPKDGDYTLRYNLFDSSGKEITDSAKIRWNRMPQAISPGETVTLDAKIAPLTPGTYTLQWTMSEADVSRFTSAGVPGPAVKLSSVNIPPQLTAASPGSGATVDSLTPTLWAKGTDADRYPKSALQYSFEVCEAEGSNLRKNCRTDPRGAEQQWAVPSGWLEWGKSYAWYAYAYDGAGTSVRPGPALLTTQVPQPTVTSHLGGADDGKEIGTRAGNYVTAATDSALTTVGPELAVTRTYNSLDPRRDGAFGTGWSTRWDMRVREEPDTSSVLVTLPDGAQVRFGRDPDGTYAGPPGGFFTLVAEDGWVLRERSGATYRFLPGGALAEIMDAAGRRQTVTHAAPGGGQVTKVTDVLSGRALSFTWTGAHITSVTTSAVDAKTSGLTWTYTYDGDRLTTVCPPSSAAKCTRYEYSDGSVYRSSVLDAAPASYWRLGEGEGAVAKSEAVSRTGLNDALYRDVQLGTDSAIAGTTDTSAGFDGANSVIELPTDTLKRTAFPALELWFKTSTPVGVLAAFQDTELGEKPSSWRTTLNIDGAGKLRGEFYLSGVSGATPIISSQSVTDGKWHHAVLSAGATAQTLYLDGVRVGSLSGALTEQARGHAYLGAGYGSSGWMGLDDDTYYFKGQLDEVAVYDHPLDAATVAAHYAARSAIGQMTKVTLPSGRIHATAAYDPANGRLTQHTDENGGAWKVSAPSYSTASSSYAETIQRSQPTGYWRLGELSGAVASSPLGEGLAGSFLSGAKPGAPGVFRDGDDAAASFDGDGAVEVPAEAFGDQAAMTVELWFRTSGSGVLVTMQDTVFGDAPTGWRPMLLVDADGKVRGKFTPDASSLLSKSRVDDDEWHHVMLTGGSDAQALYVDGVLQGVGQTGVSTFRHPHALIGGGFASSGWDGRPNGYRSFTGQIDEVAFYGRSLVSWSKSPSWTPRTGSGTGPVAHYQARKSLVTGTGDQYRGVAVADAPAAYWRLGESQGPALTSEVGGPDQSATYQPSSCSGLATAGAFGASDDTALRFDGKNTVRLPSDTVSGTTDLSAETWFRTVKHSAVLLGFQNVPAGQSATSWRSVLNIDGEGKLRGAFRLSGGEGATTIVSPAAVTDGRWHHVVLSAAGSTQSLYLDGVKVGALSGALTEQSRPYTYLGGGYGSTGWMGLPDATYYFDGDMDEVAFYRKPLSADQVAAHYRAQAEPAASGLTASIKVTDPEQRTTTTAYDALHGHRTVSRTDETGGVTGYAYDTAGNVHTVTDPNGHPVVTGHDTRGNVVSTTTCRDADSCWTSFASYHLDAGEPLDPRNDKPLSHRDQRSTDHKDDRYRTQYTYNAQGLPLTTTRPDGSTASTTYTQGVESATGGGTVPPGLVATQTAPGGAKTSYHYYANGDLAQVTTPSGLVTRYAYDGLGRRTAETQVSDTFPDGVTTTYVYDTASRVVSETGAAVENEITGTTHAAKIIRAYDEDGNLLSETAEDTTGGDPARTTVYHYDEYGLNDSITDAEQNTTRYEHDAFGRIRGETDAAGTRLSHTFTPTGHHATTAVEDWTGDPSGTVRDLTVVSNAHDPAGRLASTTDAMGATTEYTYFDDGLPATTTAKQVTREDGTRHDVVLEANTYDPAGHLTKQVTGGGTTTETFTVDALGRTTTSVLDPGGLNRASTYTYDADDRITEQTQLITDDKKLTTTAEYDQAGNVTKETVTDGTSIHTTTHTYDDRGLPLTLVSPRGNTTDADPAAYTATYRYDELGRPVAESAPEVRSEENGQTPVTMRPTVLTGYNAFGEATEVKDAHGRITRTEVDLLGRTTAMTLPDYSPPGVAAPLTATTRTVYNPLGLPQSVTDPLGRVTRYGYDQFGQLTSRTDPVADAAAVLRAMESSGPDLLVSPSVDGGGVTRHTWTPTGLQLSVTDPTGARSEATYDELGRQLTATTVERFPEPQNLISRYTWDDAGNQTTSTSPADRVTSAAYNPAGEVMSVTDAAGTTRFAYDGLGRQTSTTDATNRTTRTAYDTLGNPTTVTDYGTGSTALRTVEAEFDADGNRTAVISAETKARTTYSYDVLGRMTKQVEPVTDSESITTTFGYDAAGNRTRLTDGRGNTTVYTFNSWGLPESTIEPSTTAHPNAVDRTWTTVYDKAGQAVTELLPGGVKRERVYDGLGRLTHETGTGAESATTDRTLGYDLAGRLTSVGSSEPLNPNTYTYNDRGQLLTANGPAGEVSYTYDTDGNMTERTDAKNTTSYGYDSAGRLDWLWNQMTGADIWYEWDAVGRPVMEQYAIQPEGSTEWVESARRSYGYDSLGRLTDDIVTTPDEATDIATTTYAYNLDDRLTWKGTAGTAGAGEHVYGYDQAGRLTYWTGGDKTTHYQWDAAGNRVEAGLATSEYDERNRVLSDGTSTYQYTPRGTLSTVEKETDSRALTFDAFERKVKDGPSTFTYDSLDRVATNGTAEFRYDGGSNDLLGDGTTDYSRTPEGSLLASTDGTTTQWSLTDQHTDLVAGLSVDGLEVTGSTAYDPFGTKTAAEGNMPAVGYQSGWTDPDSGDVNMAARWYQPGTGAFASRDTWQINASPSAQANRFGYANADPLNGTDPTGHVCACGGGATTFRMYGGSYGGTLRGGRGMNTAPKGGISRNWSARIRPKTGSRNGRVNSRSQARKNAAEIYRLETRLKPINSTTSSSRSTTSRGCAYGCSTRTVNRNTNTTRSSRTSGTGTVKPPKPPTPQNPNRGSSPRPAPARPAPKPSVAIASVQQRALDRAVVADQRAAVEASFDFIEQYTPAYEPAPSIEGGGNTGDRGGSDCRRQGIGWVDPSPRDAAHGDRATGVEACLDLAYVTTHPGTKADAEPPGYQWARNYVSHLGGRRRDVHACHLLGAQLSGSGTDLANLATCGADANSYVGKPQKPIPPMDSMLDFEDTVRSLIDARHVVRYKVTPVYSGSRTVPYEFRMSYTAWDSRGRHASADATTVSNLIYTAGQGWKNLGRAIDSRTGVDAPLPGQP
ncbi:LamG-like jellyroll fold domain-containing protein [Streptomyces sp. NPDC090114]|uniref:LamG-like jellyroll fold domain-containing protein n=1 Tax=Streptomyces sp. NPDC090114 TaxID=3365950 RepID=UPI0037F28C6A